jgi:hypothetical protein
MMYCTICLRTSKGFSGLQAQYRTGILCLDNHAFSPAVPPLVLLICMANLHGGGTAGRTSGL